MKFIHVKTRTLVEYDDVSTLCIGIDDDRIAIPLSVVSVSADWAEYKETPPDIKSLMDIPCLSVNDIGKVFVTANRKNFHQEWGIEKNAKALVEMVMKKLDKRGIVEKMSDPAK